MTLNTCKLQLVYKSKIIWGYLFQFKNHIPKDITFGVDPANEYLNGNFARVSNVGKGESIGK